MKKEIELKVFPGEEDNSKVYVLSQSLKGLNAYERAKVQYKFVERETKVLEIAIENDLREFFRSQGISIQDGSNQALQRAFVDLEHKGMSIEIRDRYYELGNERIIGESNNMTIILEDDTLSCAVEVIIYGTN